MGCSALQTKTPALPPSQSLGGLGSSPSPSVNRWARRESARAVARRGNRRSAQRPGALRWRQRLARHRRRTGDQTHRARAAPAAGREGREVGWTGDGRGMDGVTWPGACPEPLPVGARVSTRDLSAQRHSEPTAAHCGGSAPVRSRGLTSQPRRGGGGLFRVDSSIAVPCLCASGPARDASRPAASTPALLSTAAVVVSLSVSSPADDSLNSS